MIVAGWVDQSPNVREMAKCQGSRIKTGFEREKRKEKREKPRAKKLEPASASASASGMRRGTTWVVKEVLTYLTRLSAFTPTNLSKFLRSTSHADRRPLYLELLFLMI